MTPLVRKIIWLTCSAMVAGSLMAYFATGSYAFTRFEDPEITTTNESTDLADLFNDSGAELEPLEEVESINAIGLLPSGPGKAAISVATLSGPAVVIAALTGWFGRKRNTQQPAESAPASVE